MGLSTYEIDVFLKDRFHVNICVILFIIRKIIIIIIVKLFLLVRIYEHPGSDVERVGHSRCDADHSFPLVPRLSMSRSYTSSSPMCLHGM
jgi:hypothetical protein